MERLVDYQSESLAMSQQVEVQAKLSLVQDLVERSLASTLHLSVAMTAYIEAKDGVVEEQEVMGLMASLFDHSQGAHVRSFGLIEGTTIKLVYPVEANDSALGIDLRLVPEQWPQLLTAMNSSEGVLAGPFELLQGGKALIYRMPIRTDGVYWGVFNTVIDLDSFLSMIETSVGSSEVQLAVRNADLVLLGLPQTFDDQAQSAVVAVPGGEWQLAMTKRKTSKSETSTIVAWRLLGWALAFLMGTALIIILIQRNTMRSLALIDELTGIANLRQFDLMLERFCSKYHRRDTGRFALLYVDLDRFK